MNWLNLLKKFIKAVGGVDKLLTAVFSLILKAKRDRNERIKRERRQRVFRMIWILSVVTLVVGIAVVVLVKLL